MKTIRWLTTMVAITTLGAPALAQTYAPGEFRVHDRERGESSVDTGAPSIETLRAAIRDANANPARFSSLLEYGERVECYSCVPEVQRLLLSSPHAEVRESAAWWLRRRPFAIGAVFVQMRDVLARDPSDTRRQYAAEALGTLMDPHALEPLRQALATDPAANVRVAAVRSLARLNVGRASEALAMALADRDPAVQSAALQAITEVGFFDEVEPVVGLLASEHAHVRRQAARAVGLFRVESALPALGAMLVGDVEWSVRQAAAWALGRIGGPRARAILVDAEPMQDDDRVLDAIRLALRSMR